MLHNAATEPEVAEFALFLNRMGAIAPTPGWSADSGVKSAGQGVALAGAVLPVDPDVRPQPAGDRGQGRPR